MCIAKHTWIWSTTCQIFFNKIFNYKTTKFFTDVKNIMGEAMFDCGLSCIIKGIKVATTGFFFTSSAMRIVPCFHSNAHYFITLVMKHQGGNGTVNTTAHCHQNFSFFTHKKTESACALASADKAANIRLHG